MRAWELWSRMALLVSIVGVSGCGDSGVDPPRPTSVRVEAQATTFSALGQSTQLDATVLDQNGAALDGSGTPIWSSDEPSVVEVDTNGLATSRAPGTARITATLSSLSGSIDLSVEVGRVVGSVSAPGRAIRVPLPASAPTMTASSTDIPDEFSGMATETHLIVLYRDQAVPALARGSSLADPSTAESVRHSLAERARATIDEVDIGSDTGGSALRAGRNPERALDASVAGISPVLRAVRLEVGDPRDVPEVRERFSSDPWVASISEDGVAEAHGEPVRPTDPFHHFQAWNHGIIDLPFAWERTTGSASVLVAVLDDGVRFDHPDLAPNLTSDGYDFVRDEPLDICSGGATDLGGDGDGYDPDPTIPRVEGWNPGADCVTGPTAIGGHGLHTTGIVGSVANNGIGGAGVAWNIRIRPVRVLGTINQGFFYDIAQGVLYAAGLPADDGAGGLVQTTEPARVISMSLGGSGFNDVLRLATEAATDAGALLIASAGNNNSSAVQYPAAFDDVMNVSAVGPTLEKATYSNFGATVDIAAPGGQSSAGFSHSVFSLGWNFLANSPVVSRGIQGTSMAVPHVTGVAALVLSVDPGLTPAQLRDRLTSTAVDLGVNGRDDVFGHGLVNARLAVSNGQEEELELRARLYDAANGSIVETRTVEPDGSFEFSGMPAGDYWVLAGNADGNGTLGRTRYRWGAFGTAARPMSLSVVTGQSTDASFTSVTPFESEGNDALETANLLVFGGNLLGSVSGSDMDLFEFRVGTAGSYAFETSGWYGLCGFGGEVDTFLELLDSGGAVLQSNDDEGFSDNRLCSALAGQLQPGVYYLRVTQAPSKGVTGDPPGGRYSIRSIFP